MKTICNYISGSRLYGLDTPDSDIDERGVFINTDAAHILGLSINDATVKTLTDSKQDSALYELRKFMTLLSKGNVTALECLFAPKEAFSIFTEEWERIVLNRKYLVNTKGFASCLAGFAAREIGAAFTKTKSNDGKKNPLIDNYGFIPKSASHVFRLLSMGIKFFRDGELPVSLKGEKDFDFIFNVKTKPELFSKEIIFREFSKYEKEFFEAVEMNNNHGFSFDEDLANKLLYDIYLPNINN